MVKEAILGPSQAWFLIIQLILSIQHIGNGTLIKIYNKFLKAA